MKAGTTSAFRYLSTQPDVAVPRLKEPNFFSADLHRHPHTIMRHTLHAFATQEWITRPDEYAALYAQLPPEKRFYLDASTTYLYSRDAAALISAYNPLAKIIIFLRDPIWRAWSEYLMNRRIGVERGSFRRAVKSELKELARGRSFLYRRYVQAGLYREQVGRYVHEFPRENIFLRVIDQPGAPMIRTLIDLADWLDLVRPPEDADFRENSAARATLPWLNNVLYFSGLKAAVSRLVATELKESIKVGFYAPASAYPPPEDVALLRTVFREDVDGLARDTGLGVQHWLKG